MGYTLSPAHHPALKQWSASAHFGIRIGVNFGAGLLGWYVQVTWDGEECRTLQSHWWVPRNQTKPVLALRPCGANSSECLAANGKTLNDGVVTRQVPGFQVVQKIAALAHQFEQSAPGMVVF